jgi:hypothetical protein
MEDPQPTTHHLPLAIFQAGKIPAGIQAGIPDLPSAGGWHPGCQWKIASASANRQRMEDWHPGCQPGCHGMSDSKTPDSKKSDSKKAFKSVQHFSTSRQLPHHI